MNAGTRSTRASASAVHVTRAGAVPSLTIAANGQPGPCAPETLSVVPSNASARALAIVLRRCSNGAAGETGPPTLTPRLFTICVSNGLVSIATRKPHSGQRKTAVSEPSAGPSVEWSFIGASQSRQRNFTARDSSRTTRSEEHTSELQSRLHLVCRLLLEKKKKKNTRRILNCDSMNTTYDARG